MEANPQNAQLDAWKNRAEEMRTQTQDRIINMEADLRAARETVAMYTRIIESCTFIGDSLPSLAPPPVVAPPPPVFVPPVVPPPPPVKTKP